MTDERAELYCDFRAAREICSELIGTLDPDVVIRVAHIITEARERGHSKAAPKHACEKCGSVDNLCLGIRGAKLCPEHWVEQVAPHMEPAKRARWVAEIVTNRWVK